MSSKQGNSSRQGERHFRVRLCNIHWLEKNHYKVNQGKLSVEQVVKKIQFATAKRCTEAQKEMMLV